MLYGILRGLRAILGRGSVGGRARGVEGVWRASRAKLAGLRVLGRIQAIGGALLGVHGKNPAAPRIALTLLGSKPLKRRSTIAPSSNTSCGSIAEPFATGSAKREDLQTLLILRQNLQGPFGRDSLSPPNRKVPNSGLSAKNRQAAHLADNLPAATPAG